MPNKNKITNGKYITYEDYQSLGDTHDMIVKALPGQSYVKETLHKVSTTQVTGDALMKVSVGGKGGFAAGTAGDVREQKKELNAEVIRMEKKEVFAQRLAVMQELGIEREYYDFMHQSECDASDYMKGLEWLYRNQDVIPPEKLEKTIKYAQRHGNKTLIYEYGKGEKYSKERLNKARERYDEICGYRGAWKFLGFDGNEHRRYRIFVFNTLNFNDPSNENKGRGGNYWEPKSYSCHHKDLYHYMNLSYIYNDDSILDDWMAKANNGHAAHIIWWLDQQKKEFNPETWYVFDPAGRTEVVKKPSEEFLRIKDKMECFYRKKRLEVIKSDSWKELTRDWRVVYNWELTKQGKVKFA